MLINFSATSQQNSDCGRFEFDHRGFTDCTVGLGGTAAIGVVVLSQPLIQSLDDGQLEFVLAHELAHLKRRDHWSNLFGFFVTTLFWWHPVAWLARRELSLAAESCCDAMALEHCSGSRKSYAQTLLSVIDLVHCREFSRPALLLNFHGTSSLRKRIQMLTDSTVRTRISVADGRCC